MKLVIFAGGKGTRLWPLSRENSPKQFDQIFSGKSTIQLAVDRIAPVFGIENVFIQTLESYRQVILEQLPLLPPENIIIEPERRNLAPAVCLCMVELKKRGFTGPVSLLWADHLMERVNEFTDALSVGEKLIAESPDRFVFLAERPRFANNNLGWIKVGQKVGELEGKDYHAFAGWKYRPPVEECDHMFKEGNYFWNPGYFITSIDFLIDRYQVLAPQIYADVTGGNYQNAEKIHFDEAIIEKVDLSAAVVIQTNMGWSDPGTLYALKEALEESTESNVVQGLVQTLDSSDSLFYNLEDKKLITAIGLHGMVVVNTPDALIVVPKNEVVKITKLIDQMKDQGLNEYL
jgi:mannose-1-phosphate guanylyltransferase